MHVHMPRRSNPARASRNRPIRHITDLPESARSRLPPATLLVKRPFDIQSMQAHMECHVSFIVERVPGHSRKAGRAYAYSGPGTDGSRHHNFSVPRRASARNDLLYADLTLNIFSDLDHARVTGVCQCQWFGTQPLRRTA